MCSQQHDIPHSSELIYKNRNSQEFIHISKDKRYLSKTCWYNPELEMFLSNRTDYSFISDEIIPLPVQVSVVKPDPDRANPKIGISAVAFSADNRYLATKNGNNLNY